MLRLAIEQCGAYEFAKNPKMLEATKDAFRASHESWCGGILKYLKGKGLSKDQCTFGRAAKLIAPYLKGMIVNGGHDCLPVAVIHPPIDRVLLRRMAKETGNQAASTWAKRGWRELRKDQYYQLIKDLAPAGQPLWMLEQYWIPDDMARSSDWG